MKKYYILILLIFFKENIFAQQYLYFTINQPDSLVINAGVDTTIYEEGYITLGGNPAITGGAQPYSVLWQPGLNLSDSTIANPIAYITSSISYILSVIDANNCSAYDTVNIEVILGNSNKNIEHSPLVFFNSSTNSLILDKLKSNSVIQLTIYSVHGDIVFKNTYITKNNNLIINKLPQLPDFFIIQILYNNKFFNYKINKY